MIIRSKAGFRDVLLAVKGSTAQRIGLRCRLMTLLACGAVYWAQYLPVALSRLGIAPFTLIGIAISPFLGFRNSACHARWWERRRPAMRRPTNATLDRTAPSTAKTGKSHRDRAKMRRDHMVPVILEVTNATTASALWPRNRVAPGLGGNDLLLEACQHPFPVGRAQTQIGDIIELIRPVRVRSFEVDFNVKRESPSQTYKLERNRFNLKRSRSNRRDVGKRFVTVSPDLHQPHYPSHASTPGQTKDAKIPLRPSRPQTCGGPCGMVRGAVRSTPPGSSGG
jgi:hypothetical protein